MACVFASYEPALQPGSELGWVEIAASGRQSGHGLRLHRSLIEHYGGTDVLPEMRSTSTKMRRPYPKKRMRP